MPNKCVAVNYRSGYPGEPISNSVIMHRFPMNDADLLEKWVNKIARVDFKPSIHSRVCSLHFQPTDFRN